MLKDYFLMALGNLKHRGIRSWLTMLGIFIGIAAVVSLISLGNGLESAVTGQFASLSADTLMITNAETGFGPPGSTAVRKLNDHDVDIVKSVPGLEMVIPRLIRSVRVEYNDIVKFKYAASMPEDSEQIAYIYRTMGFDVEEGRLLKPSDRGKILIGSNFVTEKDFDKDVILGSKIKVQNKSFEVIGILKESGTMQINLAGMIMESDLKAALDIGDEQDIIIARVSDKNRIEEIAELIKKKMRRDRDEKAGEEDFSVQTPIQALQSVNLILNIINFIVAGIAAISLLVGGVGIANTMYTSVLERRKDIGVMKAVGARNSDILKIFIVESGMLGLAGGVVGAILGLGFAFLVSFIANSALNQQILAVSVSYPLLFLAISFSFIVGVIAGLSPAFQASNTRPVEALRT
ncbi:MAG: ABC transporter permease [archaeon]|jgi:putative ABC transport system permease protein|nr:ABC transporter permease [archaeon]